MKPMLDPKRDLAGATPGAIMSKRPDYGDATPEDLARALMRPRNARRKKGRCPQPDPDTSAASQQDQPQRRPSEPECPRP